MATATISKSKASRTLRSRRVVLAGAALIVAAGVQADGGILTAAYRTDSPVNDDLLRYPWQGASAAASTITWGVTQLMITGALVVFACCGATGSSRSGKVGAWLAVGGGVLFSLGHAATLVSLDATIDDPAGAVVMGLFGLGTLLNAVGFILAGVATERAGWWSGWCRFTPLVVGIATVVLIPLQFTSLLPVTVALYSLTLIALGVAMVLEGQSASPASDS
jgi:hypothetical protein